MEEKSNKLIKMKNKFSNISNASNIKSQILKILFILSSILLIIPSLIYIFQNGSVKNFKIYYNFFLNTEANKIIAGICFLILFTLLFIIYLIILKKKDIFKNIKQVLIFVGIIGLIFIFMMPWTSSDIFYYMGVGELDGVYAQNPYYTTVKDYYEENIENINDEILEKGAENGWSDTTVVYGPVAQLIFKLCSSISFKNIDFCLFVYKLVNLILLIASTYLIYKITNKKRFSLIFGLNPFILIEFLGNVHNDIIVVFFAITSIYFLLKKKNILLSVIFLAIATGIKYFTVLLLPVIVIYYFRKEKNLGKRFAKCIQYGLLFILILAMEYIIYFRDFSILSAMMVQTTKYAKSIYSSLYVINKDLINIVKKIVYILFFVIYIKFCIDLLTTKDIKWYKVIRKYNFTLIVFSLLLGTFQQWYIIWIFASFMWQKPNMIRNIVGITLACELANSVYMFNVESYTYDIYFIECIAFLLIAWQIITNKFGFLAKRKELKS